jgi:hypothetical protein
MGFTPAQVDRMTLWEFAACADGYRKAHAPPEMPDPPTPAEFEQMVQRHVSLTKH